MCAFDACCATDNLLLLLLPDRHIGKVLHLMSEMASCIRSTMLAAVDTSAKTSAFASAPLTHAACFTAYSVPP